LGPEDVTRRSALAGPYACEWDAMPGVAASLAMSCQRLEK
jgi:hypothetical protein